MKISVATQKYLQHYRENECAFLPPVEKHFQNVLVIPVYAESLETLWPILLSCDQADALAILVINAPDPSEQTDKVPPDSTSHLLTQTEALLHTLEHHFPVSQHNENIRWHATHTHPDFHNGTPFLVIDRCTPNRRLSPKEGVGRARKIGSDIALKLISDGSIRSHWIHTTDADVALPSNYFAATRSCQAGAAIYPFIHHYQNDFCDQSTAQATWLHDFWLRYYAEGLRYARSPYAHISIGSCLAIHSESYSSVRGFPARSGGEDFYLLNKIAKTSQICSLSHPVIQIRCRRSNRTPFGTGPSVEKILALPDPICTFGFYHPHSFEALKALLYWAKQTFQDETLWQAPEKLKTPCFWENLFKKACPASLLAPLTAALPHTFFTHLSQKLVPVSKNGAILEKHFHQWFDGFQTMKVLNALRSSHFPDQPLCCVIHSQPGKQALDAMPHHASRQFIEHASLRN
jgi:hypothetical protein